jgi:hypothetical protein
MSRPDIDAAQTHPKDGLDAWGGRDLGMDLGARNEAEQRQPLRAASVWEEAPKSPGAAAAAADGAIADDEFFDAAEYQSGGEDEKGEDASQQVGAEAKPASAAVRPRGVRRVLSGKFLLNGEPMNEPHLQEVPALTIDQLEEQQELLTRLGDSRDAARRRAELLGNGLRSDMQAFKAANPSATLEDFVRWHSPNDWVEEDDHQPGYERREEKTSGLTARRGRLSARMRDPGNVWQRFWAAATPQPAVEQQPLFDALLEGERILDYLENVQPQLLLSQLGTMAVFNAIHTLIGTSGVQRDLPSLQPLVGRVRQLARTAMTLEHGQLGRASLTADSPLRNLFEALDTAELCCARAAALLAMLPSAQRLAAELLQRGSTDVASEAERAAVSDAFADSYAWDKAAAPQQKPPPTTQPLRVHSAQYSILKSDLLRNCDELGDAFDGDEYADGSEPLIVNRLFAELSAQGVEMRLAIAYSH